MPTLTPAAREQLWRIVRIFAVGLVTQPVVASLVSTTLVRYPLILAVITAIEVTYHEVTRPREVIKPGSAVGAPSPPGT